MGFTDSIKKVIGIEEIEDDQDDISQTEVDAMKEKMAKEPRRSYSEPTITSSPDSRPPSVAARSSKSSSSGDRHFSVTTGTGTFRMVLIEPKSFEECPKLVDCLKGRRPVIINLEKLETEVARKIFDFLSGATYALNGNVQKVANNIFIFAPDNVDITAHQEEKRSTMDSTAGSVFPSSEDNKSPWR